MDQDSFITLCFFAPSRLSFFCQKLLRMRSSILSISSASIRSNFHRSEQRCTCLVQSPRWQHVLYPKWSCSTWAPSRSASSWSTASRRPCIPTVSSSMSVCHLPTCTTGWRCRPRYASQASRTQPLSLWTRRSWQIWVLSY